MCFALGINPLNISKRSGHSDPSTTTDIYAHVLDDDEDGLPSDVPLIWKEQFARAKPGLPRVIDGTIEGSSLIDVQATMVSSVTIADNAQPYVPEALRLLESGWRVSQVSRHLGQTRSTIFRAFAKAGLDSPNTYVTAARERRFQHLIDKGYGDMEIARMTNVSHVTVLNYRRTAESGKPNTSKALNELKKERMAEGVFRGKFLEKQPKLL
jgi:AraC-like DNA-binding protein